MKSFNRLRQLNNVVCKTIDDFGMKDVVVADIATDHGYLAELLSRNEKISKVIATDISEKCLNKTRELVERCELQKIETKLGDGLIPIDSVDLCVLAGIGGYEIIRILKTQNYNVLGGNKCDIFVLQPSKNAEDLRCFLIDVNIKIISDFVVFSGGKFYPIIVINLFEKNDTEKSIFNIYFGRDNKLENADFIRFLEEQIKEYLFLEKIDKLDIENSNDLKTKYEIFKLAKELLNKSKGE